MRDVQECYFFDLFYIPDVGSDDVADAVAVVIGKVSMDVAIEMVDEMVVGSVESTRVVLVVRMVGVNVVVGYSDDLTCGSSRSGSSRGGCWAFELANVIEGFVA